MVTHATIGRHLRSARLNRSLTQEKVARDLGLPRAAVSQMESGARKVSSLELADLARLYGVDLAYFLSRDGSQSILGGRAVRLRAHELTSADLRVVDQAVSLCRTMSELEGLLGRPDRPAPVARYNAPEPRSVWHAIQLGEDVAERERARLSLGVAPLPGLNELVDILHLQGVRVMASRFNSPNISGLTIQQGEAGSTIIINLSHRRTRRRFTLAHEYMHALVDGARRSNISTVENGATLVEVRANAFAAALLLPSQGVAQLVRGLGKAVGGRLTRGAVGLTGPVTASLRASTKGGVLTLADIVIIQAHFGASYAATLFRLQNLGYLTESERVAREQEPVRSRARHLTGELGLGEEGPEEDTLATVSTFTRHFVKTSAEAYVEGHISRDRLMELLEEVSIRGHKARTLLADLDVDLRDGPSEALAP